MIINKDKEMALLRIISQLMEKKIDNRLLIGFHINLNNKPLQIKKNVSKFQMKNIQI